MRPSSLNQGLDCHLAFEPVLFFFSSPRVCLWIVGVTLNLIIETSERLFLAKPLAKPSLGKGAKVLFQYHFTTLRLAKPSRLCKNQYLLFCHSHVPSVRGDDTSVDFSHSLHPLGICACRTFGIIQMSLIVIHTSWSVPGLCRSPLNEESLPKGFLSGGRRRSIRQSLRVRSGTTNGGSPRTAPAPRG